jgi:flagellar protein FliS
MFTSISMRSANTFRAANAYKDVAVETSVSYASPYQLVRLLYEALQHSLATAKVSMTRGDIVAKGKAIGHAVRILEEGLKAGLDMERGGELAQNLKVVYDICTLRLTEANLHNDVSLIDEVNRLIQPLVDGWNQIEGDEAVKSYLS